MSEGVAERIERAAAIAGAGVDDVAEFLVQEGVQNFNGATAKGIAEKYMRSGNKNMEEVS